MRVLLLLLLLPCGGFAQHASSGLSARCRVWLRGQL
jgi:hypothetical protein